MTIVGHASHTGTAEYNYDLSARRAGSVAVKLLQKIEPNSADVETSLELLGGDLRHENSSVVNLLISGGFPATWNAYHFRNNIVGFQAVSGAASRLSIIGKGYDENIIGSGTDDEQDAVDRRVEFRPVHCEMRR
jgi:outer membrane protein OmpA-like peptidoglycan-associated protein